MPPLNGLESFSRTVIVQPVFVTRRRWENLLHNQSTIVLRKALGAQGSRVVTTVGFYL